MNIALDTNAYSDSGRKIAWVKTMKEATRIYLPLPIIGELRAGFVRGSEAMKNEKLLQNFLNKPRVEILFPNLQTTHHYAWIQDQLRKQGTPIPTNDIWIAALCLQHELPLCTSDVHYENIPQLICLQKDV